MPMWLYFSVIAANLFCCALNLLMYWKSREVRMRLETERQYIAGMNKFGLGNLTNANLQAANQAIQPRGAVVGGVDYAVPPEREPDFKIRQVGILGDDAREGLDRLRGKT